MCFNTAMEKKNKVNIFLKFTSILVISVSARNVCKTCLLLMTDYEIHSCLDHVSYFFSYFCYACYPLNLCLAPELVDLLISFTCSFKLFSVLPVSWDGDCVLWSGDLSFDLTVDAISVYLSLWHHAGHHNPYEAQSIHLNSSHKPQLASSSRLSLPKKMLQSLFTKLTKYFNFYHAV